MSEIARKMASRMKEVSFSEFIAKNPHLVGFESSVKMLPMSVHELMTNSMDACEEAGTLPEIWVELRQVEDSSPRRGSIRRFKLTVRDNGPGILHKKVGDVFGKLLFGSKFDVRRQSRGQQGIGVSAVVLISQIKTGEQAIIRTSTTGKLSNVYRLSIDIARNTAIIHERTNEGAKGWTGVDVSVTLEAQWNPEVLEYLQLTCAINPHLTLHYSGYGVDEPFTIERSIPEMPRQPVETKPHPTGVDFDVLSGLAGKTRTIKLEQFLREEFDRIGPKVLEDILKRLKKHIDLRKNPKSWDKEEINAIVATLQDTKFMSPSTECLSPVGEEVLLQGVILQLKPQFIKSVTRRPSVWRGHPFIVEVIIAYNCETDIGGNGNKDAQTGVHIHRLVNRVPLLFLAGSDVITRAVRESGLDRYEIEPETRTHIFVHVAGVNIPYTSESKEAVKQVDEYYEELKLALKECGRRISSEIRKVKRQKQQEERGMRRALVHSLLIQQFERFTGQQLASKRYAKKMGFEDTLNTAAQKWKLDIWKPLLGEFVVKPEKRTVKETSAPEGEKQVPDESSVQSTLEAVADK